MYISYQSIQCYWSVHMFSADCFRFSNPSIRKLVPRKSSSSSFSIIDHMQFFKWEMRPCEMPTSMLAYQLKLSSFRSCLMDYIVDILGIQLPCPVQKTLAVGILVLWLLQSSASHLQQYSLTDIGVLLQLYHLGLGTSCSLILCISQ